uniref:G-protein coupled receptors family 1 profile domain-containing protein n=1 Tax=Meloidogyne incognita TaxID=6306 RepID=A0A914MBR2_MELIC
MVRYVNLNTNLDGNLKRLNKLLTKVLIILAVVPFINQTGNLFFAIFPKTNNNTTNIIRILFFISSHFIPVFNPIICILANTPYRNAIFNRAQTHPQ